MPCSQAALDDETGYTTSEEQGDKGDMPPAVTEESKTSNLSSAPQSPSIACGSQASDGLVSISLAKDAASAGPAPISVSTQTQDLVVVAARVQVDKGMQCVAPVGASNTTVDRGTQCVGPPPTVMVSCGAQCGGAAIKTTSCGVQCIVRAPTQGVSCGIQCSADPVEKASVGIQSAVLVDDGREGNPGPVEHLAGGPPQGAASANGGTGQSLLDDSQGNRDLGEASDDGTESVTPQPSPARIGRLDDTLDDTPPTLPALPTLPVALVKNFAGRVHGSRTDGGIAANSKKNRRKRAKAAAARSATGSTGRTCAPPFAHGSAGDSAGQSPAGWRMVMGRFVGTRGGWLRRCCILFGVASLVLGAVWARTHGVVSLAAGAMESGRQARAVHKTSGSHEALAKQAQPPVWVVSGGSLTLGDAMASQQAEGGPDSGGAFQWVKDGTLVEGQTRCVCVCVACLELFWCSNWGLAPYTWPCLWAIVRGDCRRHSYVRCWPCFIRQSLLCVVL